VFQNIAASEQAHMDLILVLLEQFRITDPASEDKGVFTNPDLQVLYDQLIAQGSQSLKDAMLVGAAIEEIDILDLQKYIAKTVDSEIIFVYENLLRGSENHLRAFVRLLSNQVGRAYEPQFFLQEAYDQIVQGAQGNGGYGQGNSQGYKGNGNF
jgi:hypothetical protein